MWTGISKSIFAHLTGNVSAPFLRTTKRIQLVEIRAVRVPLPPDENLGHGLAAD
jgi:hypothetical protein